MTKPVVQHWARTFAFRWLIAFVLHAVVLDTLAGTGTVAELFSPGAHVSRATLAIAGAFLVLRIYVMLLGPAAVISLLAWLQVRFRRTAVAPRA